MATTTARRQARAAAEQRAARERRQVILVVGLLVVLVAVLAFELPKVLKSSSSGSSSPPATSSVPVPAAAPVPAPQTSIDYRKLLKQPARDVFARVGMTPDSTLGSVAAPPGLHDPFASPHSVDSTAAPPPAKPVVVSTLPGTIVLGTPGAGKVPQQGWIVILASIPTADGQSSAEAFAAQARKAGVDNIAILNSSNRKPLRGGYWVVYTGPYSTLPQVSSAAVRVHSAGFGTAYIRGLVVYKAKPVTKSKSKK